MELTNSELSRILILKFLGALGDITPIMVDTKANETQPKRNPDIIPFTEQNLSFDYNLYIFFVVFAYQLLTRLTIPEHL